MTAKCAVIGLGSMGLGMAKSLLQKGYAVSGADLNASAVQALGAMGGKGFATALRLRHCVPG